MSIANRKLDHIIIALSKKIETSDTLLKNIQLIHQALPELSFDSINTTVEFLGKKLSAPLMFTGITGGHVYAGDINRVLAKVAEENKIAIEVGSQRAALVDPSVSWTYRVVREEAISVPVIANLGAQQLGDKPVEIAEKAIKMIDADAIAIHLNVAQELFQLEGDRDFRNILKNIEILRNELSVPIIVKEIGYGISKEVASALVKAGVKYIDVAGAGGTSWIKVEILRRKLRGEKVDLPGIYEFYNWGIPTALSIIETRSVSSEIKIIASGGIRNGVEVAKSIAIGADIAGFALPALKEAARSKECLDRYVRNIIMELKIAMLLTSAKDVEELKNVPIVFDEKITNWLSQRGIDPIKFLENRKIKKFS
ncbi:type 2 isopentenyl-diphosphate Delta-isomerase [Fervidicoccus fontis]|uniref:Isopentenyl-diphosphate delta-isomerase n=1 Tax=Fervidicoccus fontis TaxID=683846 RepID=A0A843AHK3_9CREN|nr:type 2 isopentenyl-diphosphate Delta-isomerase [Fervidicoccus fontis]MBE9391059.1 type 2 isopentenyl-diphosphate Delta-isomerase [Fervidicoccus fontis]